jgi:hypothetical protein
MRDGEWHMGRGISSVPWSGMVYMGLGCQEVVFGSDEMGMKLNPAIPILVFCKSLAK